MALGKTILPQSQFQIKNALRPVEYITPAGRYGRLAPKAVQLTPPSADTAKLLKLEETNRPSGSSIGENSYIMPPPTWFQVKPLSVDFARPSADE